MTKLALLLTAFLLLSSTFAQDQMENLVSVTGTGTVFAEPDLATFDVGVSARSPDVTEATDEVNRRVAQLLAALRAEGVAEEDIRTVDISIFPEYDYNRNDQPTNPRFRVSNVVRVNVRDTAQLGTLLGRSVQAGANEVSNVRYSFADPGALEARAREGAVNAARTKAEQLAELAGVSLGAAVRITEQGGGVQPVMQSRMATAEMASDAAMPVSAGQLSVSVSVSVDYAID